MKLLFTGNGKGKTSSAIGIIIRALGYQKKILFSQFLKASYSGELEILSQFVDIERCGTKEFVNKKNYDENKKQVFDLITKIQEKHTNKHYDLIVLDEFNLVIYSKFISVKETIDLVNKLEQIHNCDIIITGRYAKQELIDAFDLVSEIKEIKHPFNQGIPAKKGIDF